MEWRFNLLLIIALLKKKKVKSVSLKDKAIYFLKTWNFIVTLKSLYCASLSPIQILLPETKFYSCAVLYLVVLSSSCPLQPQHHLLYLPLSPASIPLALHLPRPHLSAPPGYSDFSHPLGFLLLCFPSKKNPPTWNIHMQKNNFVLWLWTIRLNSPVWRHLKFFGEMILCPITWCYMTWFSALELWDGEDERLEYQTKPTLRQFWRQGKGWKEGLKAREHLPAEEGGRRQHPSSEGAPRTGCQSPVLHQVWTRVRSTWPCRARDAQSAQPCAPPPARLCAAHTMEWIFTSNPISNPGVLVSCAYLGSCH